jgi:hypothetical protein
MGCIILVIMLIAKKRPSEKALTVSLNFLSLLKHPKVLQPLVLES